MRTAHFGVSARRTLFVMATGFFLSCAGLFAQNIAAGSNPPKTPLNVSPTNGAMNLMFPVILRSSDFSDADNADKHAASEWVVKVKRDGRTYIHTETSTTNKQTLPLPVKHPGAAYEWQVRYKDSRGAWSEFSPAATFTTARMPGPAAPKTTLVGSLNR